MSPLTLRGTTFRNRVWLAPMCQYSAGPDGLPTDWHLAHLGARAVGGFGLVMAEATAIVPEGRISPQDVGIWGDEHVAAWRRVTDLVRSRGAVAGVQLAHAGRKASTYRGFGDGHGTVPAEEGGWETVGPSDLAFAGYAAPQAMTDEQVRAVPGQFAAATRRALDAGFDLVEVHAAHGYLLHQFLSPLSNLRTDAWGGDLAGRARLLLDTVDAVRAVLPETSPLLVRVSATDWTDGGLTVEDIAQVSVWLREHGVDLVDVSTGGNVHATIPVGPGYQVHAAREIRATAGIATSAVGMITTAEQAEQVLAAGDADAVMIGRPALFDPHWALRAAHTLDDKTPVLDHAGDPAASILPGQPTGWPAQYARGSW
ncbi:NADH:flavin oxidoreductase/NADH oxidase [Cellulomonas triticagri]|uniref:NADH:flavin oxidoreductase/NADH oxidase n=1 Tax=Cellulomonas triticagri TaxID=2483352 RepID=A0A3M2JNM3_9CELL|nr:NADH:flavin oxidoreductase/NADH oxidase [Cellulomonas triticagri]RMI13911.1 NADH:flavin oxidoreductase/NADH oxidase [Cellulomonas triticagri]